MVHPLTILLNQHHGRGYDGAMGRHILDHNRIKAYRGSVSNDDIPTDLRTCRHSDIVSYNWLPKTILIAIVITDGHLLVNPAILTHLFRRDNCRYSMLDIGSCSKILRPRPNAERRQTRQITQ